MENKRISLLIILPPLIFLGLAFLFILGVTLLSWAILPFAAASVLRINLR